MKYKKTKLSTEINNSVLNFVRNVLIKEQKNQEIKNQTMNIELLVTKKYRVKPAQNWRTFEDIENKIKYPLRKPPKIKIPKFKELEELTIFDFKEIHVAQYLSLFGQNLLSKIQTSELLSCAWTKSNKQQISPNVRKLIKRFNRLSDWVTGTILKCKDDKARVKIIIKFIKIALQLQTLNNYNDVMAIMSGMEATSVSRLEKSTWKKIPKKFMEAFHLLTHLTNAKGGFQELRQALDESSYPMVPYLGVFLADLTYIHELPDRIENNLINCAKIRRYYDVIRFIKKCQAVRYNFSFLMMVKEFFERDPVLTENEIWDLSFGIEKSDW